jgi:hypothetical protein
VVTAPHSAKTASGGSAPGAATCPAADGITDRSAAGSRGIQTFPAPIALLTDLAAAADTIEYLAGSALPARGALHCAALGLATRG